MLQHVDQTDTCQVLMVALPKQTAADDFDEHRYLSMLATKWIVRILVERMRQYPGPDVPRRFHTIGCTQGWQTSAVTGTFREAFWHAQIPTRFGNGE